MDPGAETCLKDPANGKYISIIIIWTLYSENSK
jgi:hypothetical protein